MENTWMEYEKEMELPNGRYVANMNNGTLPRVFEVWSNLKVLEAIDPNRITHVMKLSTPKKDGSRQQCEYCEKEFDIETMHYASEEDCIWVCTPCYDSLKEQ